jgi:hypothetical protein
MSKIGIYAGFFDDDKDLHEMISVGDKPDVIIIGSFNDKKIFNGIIKANWCDKFYTDTLLFNGKYAFENGGFAEDSEGNNLWDEINLIDSAFQSKIESFFEYLIIDSDQEHFNIKMNIPMESRLFQGLNNNPISTDGSTDAEGYAINLGNVKLSNGYKLQIGRIFY